ncbi:ABC transporter ATP-binding protein [Limnohabitans planktonicus]|uniref:Methionine ABC transporter ATP-binding protein n=1 Tax=Limnohabitans planktonicus II-D5 TaxID=1293045 RepID=A0A2T7U9C2_9BURK|nr:ABC transporter ATP-binding protein [Limnohabitans planktonicus]PVE41252.1 methionine ABC transporter ATP-binding protein [Limnohabitans planktonicus II-D5]
MIEIEPLRYTWTPGGSDTLTLGRLQVNPGQTVFLHGPSGCGKSTLLGLLAGVLSPRQGRISLLGQDWASLKAGQRDAFRADHVGVMFQQFNLLPFLSVLDNVTLPCRFSNLRRSRCQASGGPEATAQSWLQRMGLPEQLWSRRADALSVGQQQRVAAARALMGQPELILADEPTSALDAALRLGFMDLLLQAAREAGSTLVCVSHDEQQAMRFDVQWSLPALQQAGVSA